MPDYLIFAVYERKAILEARPCIETTTEYSVMIDHAAIPATKPDLAEHWHTLSQEEVFRHLQTGPCGITEAVSRHVSGLG
uniref:Uncharacterized protein n=1 Tax=Nitrosospira lacus TaxID=1288494 RepID=A0A1W6SPZ6_9PROT